MPSGKRDRLRGGGCQDNTNQKTFQGRNPYGRRRKRIANFTTICDVATTQNIDVMGKVARRLLPFMFVLYICSYLDRINVSFAALEMNKELGFSDEIFGFGAGVFFIGYFLFGVPSNLLVERLGARKWISAIMVVWGLISVAMANVTTPLTFYVLRFLLGVAEAGFFPGMILYLTYWFPRRAHGSAVARFMSAIPASTLLGGLVASLVFKLSGQFGYPGWKLLFIITGWPSVLFGVMSRFYLTDRPQEAHWLTDEERQYLIAEIESDKPGEHSAKGIMSALSNGKVWVLAILYFSLALAMYGFQLWLPQIVQKVSTTDDVIVALLSSIPALFQALGMLVVGYHSDSTKERRLHVAGSASIAAIGFVITALSGNMYIALAALCMTAFGIWGAVGPFWALPTGYLTPVEAAGGIALINSVGNLGGFAGPYIIGFIRSHTGSFEFGLYAMAVSLAVAAALAMLTSKSS